MYNLTIAGFDTQEQLVCFVNKLVQQMDFTPFTIHTLEGTKVVEFDGMDTYSQTDMDLSMDIMVSDYYA